MKIHVLSDLHLEFRPMKDYVVPECDVVVLAGDIGTGTSGMQWAIDTFKDVPVVYVAGNHEFYRHGPIDVLYKELEALAKNTNVHFLQNSTVEILGTPFIGATMWTDWLLDGDAERSADAAMYAMADYRVIDNFTTQVAAEENLKSKQYIKDALFAGFTDVNSVVVTHHAPSSGSIHPWYANSNINAAFASDFLPLLDDKIRPRLWVHGHMHNTFDYQEGYTRVVCNPRGYPSEKSGWDSGLVVEI